MERILVIGANGQIGSELVEALAKQHGEQNVIATDISPVNKYNAARYQVLNVMDKAALQALVAAEGITQVYQLAAMLSATGEAAPLKAWDLNMDGLLNILEVARQASASRAAYTANGSSTHRIFGPMRAL